MATTSAPFLDRALPLLARGLSIIPIEPRAKTPIRGAKQRTQDIAIVEEWAAQYPDANVAICADEEVCILESDDLPQLAQLIKNGTGHDLPVTLMACGSSENRPHFFFKHSQKSRNVGCLAVPGLFEARFTNQYVVGPGSIHPSGSIYRFLNDAPIVEIPDWLVGELVRLAMIQKTDRRNPVVERNSCGKITEGGRHYGLMSALGRQWTGKQEYEELLEWAQEWNLQNCEPPKDPTHVAACVHDIMKLPPFDPGPTVVLSSQQSWLVDAEEFMQRKLEPRKPLLVDSETGAAVLFEKSLNQIFAFRGLGKSIVANALIRVLTQGGELLRFRSDGGCRTLLVDAELPQEQLQERLKEFSGLPKGFLKIVSPELMPNPKLFPVLSKPAHQAAFLEQIGDFEPKVIIFDTLTRCFKFDTNDPDGWQVVNDFLLDLRFQGHCVILIHHAGKNGTQRGLTTGDDNLDVTIQLEARYGWVPGDGLEFKWTYEKVRHGGHLPNFEAEYHGEGRWQIVQDDRTAEVVALAKKGNKSQRAIAAALDMKQPTVNRILKKAREQGLIELNEKHGDS